MQAAEQGLVLLKLLKYLSMMQIQQIHDFMGQNPILFKIVINHYSFQILLHREIDTFSGPTAWIIMDTALYTNFKSLILYDIQIYVCKIANGVQFYLCTYSELFLALIQCIFFANAYPTGKYTYYTCRHVNKTK